MNAKKVNVSVNPETMELLKAVRTRLSGELGFTPTYSQVIQHLINGTTRQVVEMSQEQGEANE
jgi:hypothetical protein